MLSPALAEPAPELEQDTPPYAQWLEAVRTQRQLLEQQRRREKLSDWPTGQGLSGQRARQAERQAQWEYRRRSRRALIDRERELFRNYGPWLEPLSPMRPGDGMPFRNLPNETHGPPEGRDAPRIGQPPGWDNRWYFHGW